MIFSYTAHKDPAVNNTIDKHMKIIAQEIEKSLVVDSILLAGGFGRGEGTVRRLSNGDYAPMNDYDLYVISNTTITYKEFQRLKHFLFQKTGVEMDLKIARTDRLQYLIPDMFTFELKVASRVICGKDLRSRIPIEKQDVPLTAGLNTLFLESIALAIYFEPDYLTGEVSPRNAPMFDYVCSKTFVEIANALSLLGGFYDPSIAKRAILLSKYYDSLFPELSAILPRLPSDVERATNNKLCYLDFGSGHLLDKWFHAREALKHTLSYFLYRILEKPVDATKLSHFLIMNRRRVANFYFEPYVEYALKRVRLPPVRLFKTSAVPVVRLYENFRYLKNYYNAHGLLMFESLTHFESPLISIYVGAVSLMLAVQENGQMNQKLVENAFNMLRTINSSVKLKVIEDQDWRKMRDSCLSAFRIYSSTPETLSF